MIQNVREAEVSWSVYTLVPKERSAMCVRATDDPAIVILEMLKPNEPMLHWVMNRSELRSLGEQLGFWAAEYGRSHHDRDENAGL